MTRFHPGNRVSHFERRGEVIIAAPCGWRDQLCAVRFGNRETWIMAHELVSIDAAPAPFTPRVVGGTDYVRETP